MKRYNKLFLYKQKKLQNMTSRVDQFFSQVFDRLNRQGHSYRNVVGYLASEGVNISAQALRSWHVRRSQKLTARAARLPLAFVHGVNSSGHRPTPVRNDPLVPHSGAARSVLEDVEADLVRTRRPSTLQAQIAEEERRLALFHRGSSTSFLVRPKNVANPTLAGAKTGRDGNDQEAIP